MVITQLFLTYNSTECATSLYIDPLYHTLSIVLSVTLAIMPHRIRALRRFMYTAAQMLLFHAIIRSRYGNASDGGRASELIWNETLLASN